MERTPYKLITYPFSCYGKKFVFILSHFSINFFLDGEKDTFKSYITKLYVKKSNPLNETQKLLAKSLLNNLLSRFGISIKKPITRIVSTDTFNRYMLMYSITAYERISDKWYIINYIPRLNNEIIKGNKLDIIKILNKYPENDNLEFNVASVAISSAIIS